MTDLTAERIRELLHYDPMSGQFTWLESHRAGKLAGCATYNGQRKLFYRKVKIYGKSYRAHRLAFLYMTGAWPVAEIDHINGDSTDNRWTNLREAPSSQNKCNSRRNNSIGFKGVYRTGRRYGARICLGGKHIHLGVFDCPQKGHEAYRAAAAAHYGEYANFQTRA